MQFQGKVNMRSHQKRKEGKSPDPVVEVLKENHGRYFILKSIADEIFRRQLQHICYHKYIDEGRQKEPECGKIVTAQTGGKKAGGR